MDVYWLEQTEADIPVEDDWLSASEAARLNGLHFAKRRADWRLGRWTAKRALATYLNLPGSRQGLTDIEIRPALSGAPEAFFANQAAAVIISLSHRGGIAACAVTADGTALGCDLELAEPRSEPFIADYFTPEEQAFIARAQGADRSRLLALLWSGKESVLKALCTGLRLDTRCVSVRVNEAASVSFQSSSGLDSWHPLRARYLNCQLFHGWWQRSGDLVRTMVSDPPSEPPIRLSANSSHLQKWCQDATRVQ